MAHLHNTADDHGQDIEWKAEDVEQGQGHKGSLGVQHIVLVDHHIDGECGQRHLQAEKQHPVSPCRRPVGTDLGIRKLSDTPELEK